MKIVIVTKNSELVDEINIGDCDLNNPIASGALWAEVRGVIERGQRIEKIDTPTNLSEIGF